jgi:hypothetical protein
MRLPLRSIGNKAIVAVPGRQHGAPLGIIHNVSMWLPAAQPKIDGRDEGDGGLVLMLAKRRRIRKHSAARLRMSKALLGCCDDLDPSGKGMDQGNRQ